MILSYLDTPEKHYDLSLLLVFSEEVSIWYTPEYGDHVVEATEWVGAGELDVRGLWPQFQLAGVAVSASYLER